MELALRGQGLGGISARFVGGKQEKIGKKYFVGK